MKHGDATGEEIDATADAGVSGSGGSLPFADQIQASFGAHDVSGVRSHIDSAATEANSSLGSTAYAKGDNIAFAGAPDLHTTAHEAAHVVQQRNGVHLKDGVGEAGDPYERHADAVADTVVRGDLAESLLSSVAGPPSGASAGSAVQHKSVQFLDNSWGSDYQKPAGPRDQTIDYNSYKDDIGKNKNEPALVPASQWGMTDTWNQRAAPDDPNHTKTKERTGLARSTELTQGEWDAILSASGEPATADRCRGWLGQVNTAFDTMMLDTAQSQALYLAHMVGETGGKLEETIDASTGPRDYDNDATGHFRGRGPVQVTFRKNYMQCIAYIETRADQLEKKDIPEAKVKLNDVGERANEDDKGKPLRGPFPAENQGVNDLVLRIEKMNKELALCRDALVAIKANPNAAKDEKYAFLFSAAFLQMSGKVRSSADMKDQMSFDGKSAASVAGSGESFDETQKKAAARSDGQTVNDMDSAKSRGSVKEKVYAAAMAILSGKQKVKEPAP